MTGKAGVAPCGHVGVHIIGTYVQCPQCDRGAVPKPVEPEKTEPLYLGYECPNCHKCDTYRLKVVANAGVRRVWWKCRGCALEFIP